MRIGIGVNRSRQEFAPYGCDEVFIDKGDNTEERELALDFEASGSLRAGQIVLLLQHADLAPHWRDREHHLRRLASAGILVQVRDQEPVLYDTEEKIADFKKQNGGTRKSKDAGRPPAIDISKAGWIRIAKAYYGDYTLSYVRRIFAQENDGKIPDDVENKLKYRLRKRDGSDKTRLEKHIGMTWGEALIWIEDKESTDD